MKVGDRQTVSFIACIYRNYRAAVLEDSSHTEELQT
jgi:hypothetical protein